MARELPYIAAINEAIHLEMERDERVLFFGQNMATTENEPFVDAFGRDRVRVTPISETAEIGIAVGAEVADQGFSALKAPVKQVTALDATIAYSAPLEAYVLPDEEKIVGAVRQVL